MKIGDIVQYVMEFDADKSYTPNVGPAIVTKVLPDSAGKMTVLDLWIMFPQGFFIKLQVPQGDGTARETWFLPK